MRPSLRQSGNRRSAGLHPVPRRDTETVRNPTGKERALSKKRRRNKDIPPAVQLIASLIMSSVPLPETEDYTFIGTWPPQDEGKVHCKNQEWHQEQIRQWEAVEDDMAKQFGKMAAADVVELNRIAQRLCLAGYGDTASAIVVLTRLMVISNGSRQVMREANVSLRELLSKCEVLEKVDEILGTMADLKAKAKARTKANGEPEPEVKATDEAKAETVPFRGEPVSS